MVQKNNSVSSADNSSTIESQKPIEPTSSPNNANPLVSGSLLIEWIKNKYPSMYRDNDYSELNYDDIQDFAFWVENEINSGRFLN